MQGIPTLVMMGPDTTILSANCRSAIGVDANGIRFPWTGFTEPKCAAVGGWGEALMPGSGGGAARC